MLVVVLVVMTAAMVVLDARICCFQPSSGTRNDGVTKQQATLLQFELELRCTGSRRVMHTHLVVLFARVGGLYTLAAPPAGRL